MDSRTHDVPLQTSLRIVFVPVHSTCHLFTERGNIVFMVCPFRASSVFGLVLVDGLLCCPDVLVLNVKNEGESALVPVGSVSPSFLTPPTLISTHCSRYVPS
jgi:hypothetical protein